jgi:hypothetical protein
MMMIYRSRSNVNVENYIENGSITFTSTSTSILLSSNSVSLLPKSTPSMTYTGQPRDYMRCLFQDFVTFYYGYDKRVSLSNCTREQDGQVNITQCRVTVAQYKNALLSFIKSLVLYLIGMRFLNTHDIV